MITSLLAAIFWFIIAYQSFNVEILTVHFDTTNSTFVHDVYRTSFGVNAYLFMLLGLVMTLRFIQDVLVLLGRSVGRW